MSGINVPVRTELTSAQYRTLSALARQHHTTISSLVRECVRRQLAGGPEPEPERRETRGQARPAQRRMTADDVAMLQQLHGEGRSDVEIAKQLGFPRSTVSYRREALGLPALYRGRAKAVAS